MAEAKGPGPLDDSARLESHALANLNLKVWKTCKLTGSKGDWEAGGETDECRDVLSNLANCSTFLRVDGGSEWNFKN